MTGNVALINPAVQPGFVETESARAMLRSLRRARAKGTITMIIGQPGTGKTKTMFHFRQSEAPESIPLIAAAGEGGVWSLACQLYERLDLGIPNHRNLAQARTEIAEAIGPDGFLMIDEAQYLIRYNERGKNNYEAFEWLRMVQEEGCFGLAWLGDTTLDHVLSRYPQLKRRTHPRVRLSATTENDVRAFCAARGVTDTHIVRQLVQCAKRFGGMGALAEILDYAKDFSETGIPDQSDYADAITFFSKGTEK